MPDTFCKPAGTATCYSGDPGNKRCLTIVVTAAIFSFNIAMAQSEFLPVCPEEGISPYPPAATTSDPPNVASWQELTSLPGNCHISLQSAADLTIALSGAFVHKGSVEQIASRLGAISPTRGLLYWSVTDSRWRELISNAYALNSPDSSDRRADFTEQEVLSGETLYFAQNDTRSWGLNVYGIHAISSSPDHLVFKSYNSSPVRLGPVTLLKPDNAQSVIFIHRLNNITWTIFTLSVIKNSVLTARKASIINRQAAFYRLLTGQAPDSDPPLAP